MDEVVPSYVLAIADTIPHQVVPNIDKLLTFSSNDRLTVVHPYIYKEHLMSMGVTKVPALITMDEDHNILSIIEGDVDLIDNILRSQFREQGVAANGYVEHVNEIEEIPKESLEEAAKRYMDDR